jgi:pentose-5-phosphate-3-epimerase
MAPICPTVTAFDTPTYDVQMKRLEPFCERVHIDLMDGVFAPTLSPGLDKVWWPRSMRADIHLMYQAPMDQADRLISLRPTLVIVHEEAEVNHHEFADLMHENNIKVGLALLKATPVEAAQKNIMRYDHVLIFSGDLGKHGGIADLSILAKVAKVREYRPDIEISWDGGVSDENAQALIQGGVDVLNVGGFIQNSDNPGAAYATLKSFAQRGGQS